MKYTAIIPARSGSKRLPNKNIKQLSGKPLLLWTIEACINCEKVNKVILSTDSEQYWDIVREYTQSEKLVLDNRTNEEAGDTVKIFDYIKNKKNKIFTEDDEVFILALPTVPLRNSKHIDDAIELFEKNGKPVFSATNYGFPISFAFTCNNEDSNSWSSVFDDSPMITGNTRSQNQTEYYHPNGAIYVRNLKDMDTEALLTFYRDAIPYIMTREDSVDIDNEIDFIIASAIIESKLNS